MAVKGVVALLVDGIADDMVDSLMERMRAILQRRREREATLRLAAEQVAEAHERGEGVLVQHDGGGKVTVTPSPFVPVGTAYVVNTSDLPAGLFDGR